MEATRMRISPAAADWEALLSAYRNGQTAGFNRSATDAFNAAESAYASPVRGRRVRGRLAAGPLRTDFQSLRTVHPLLMQYMAAFLLAALSWIAAVGGWGGPPAAEGGSRNYHYHRPRP